MHCEFGTLNAPVPLVSARHQAPQNHLSPALCRQGPGPWEVKGPALGPPAHWRSARTALSMLGTICLTDLPTMDTSREFERHKTQEDHIQPG